MVAICWRKRACLLLFANRTVAVNLSVDNSFAIVFRDISVGDMLNQWLNGKVTGEIIMVFVNLI